jgi:hypothetical protein
VTEGYGWVVRIIIASSQKRAPTLNDGLKREWDTRLPDMNRLGGVDA